MLRDTESETLVVPYRGLLVPELLAMIDKRIKGRGYSVVTANDFGLDDFSVNLGGSHCLTNALYL